MAKTKLMTAETGGKITFLALAGMLGYAGLQMIQASGGTVGPEFYGGVVLFLLAFASLVFREYWKKQYGEEPAIDLGEVDNVIAKMHEYRDFVKSHADVQLAMADMAIEIAKAANLPQPTINKIELLRSKWYAFLQTL